MIRRLCRPIARRVSAKSDEYRMLMREIPDFGIDLVAELEGEYAGTDRHALKNGAKE